VEGKEAHFTEGAAASGDWRGQRVDMAAASVSLYFAQTPTYIAEGGVRGSVGKIFVDADKLYMKGPNIAARGVRRLEDRAMDVVFGAERLEGVVSGDELTVLTAREKVWLRGRPNAAGGEAVDIRGDAAVYSVERGSVVVSGNVRATQAGRALTSQSLVYFPADNRIEAIGGVRGGENAGADPARITIDLSREERRAPR
jgi:hypothetical protein